MLLVNSLEESVSTAGFFQCFILDIAEETYSSQSGFMCVLLYIDFCLCFRVLEVRTVCQENSALKAKR